MEGVVFNRAFKNITQQSIKLIDRYISCYCSITNSTGCLYIIKQERELVAVMCNLEPGRIW